MFASEPANYPESSSIVSAALRYRKITLLFALAGALIGVIAAFVLPRPVVAEATVTLKDPTRPGLTSSGGTTATEVQRYASDRSQLATSNEVLGAAATSLGRGTTPQDLRGRCSVGSEADSLSLQFTCSGDSDAEASDAVAALVDAFRASSERLVADTAQIEIDSLERERESIDQWLAEAGPNPSGSEAKIQTERKLRIVERVAEVSVTAELLGDGVSFADPPRVVPSAGLWATVLKFAFVGLVGGLVPAMLVAWVRADRQPIAQRTDEVADLLGMAPIAHVASMSELLRTEIFDASDSSVQLCAANISSIIDGGVLLFTSPAPIIGSGEFLVKVGVGLAQAGKRVLVVDADPAGSVCRTLGIDEEVGIADVMAGQNLDRVRTANISFNRAPGLGDARLRVIAPGKTHDHMGALARTPSATAAFGEFRGQHDYVLVSLPPLSVSASSTAFGRLADGIVLSVPQGMAVDQLADTRRRVDFFGTSALGFVLIQD